MRGVFIVFVAMNFPIVPLAFGRSQRSISLIQDVEGRSKAEAMTTSARGGNALFYNPACLVHNRVELKLLGIEAIADKRILSAKGYQKERKKVGDTNSNADDDLKRAYDLVSADKPVDAVVNARVLDLAVPYFSVQNFASTEVVSGRLSGAEKPTVQADIGLRAGTIGGFGIKIGPVAIGYSKYFLIQSDLSEQLTIEQIETIKQDIDSDPSAVDRIAYKDFTNAAYGNTEGHNFGFLFQPFAENPSGLSLAVLNAGGTSFRRKLPRHFAKLKNYQKDLEAVAEKYAISLDLPAKIPQEVNAGLLFGHSAGAKDILTANLAFDYDDIDGTTLDPSKRFAASTEIGIMLPDDIAMLARREIPYYSSDKKEFKGSGFFVGLLGLKVTAGTRPNDYYAYGLTLLGHAGTKAVSFVSFALQTLIEKPLSSSRSERAGAQANIALTFIWVH